jgi:hypothetical protein
MVRGAIGRVLPVSDVADGGWNAGWHLGKARGRVSRQADCANYQLVRLGRIGYSLNEQVNYVRTALIMFRLTKTFSRFVLIVGHRGQTEKQPLSSSRVPSMEACRRYKLTDKACPPPNGRIPGPAVMN